MPKLYILLFFLSISPSNGFAQDSYTLNYECYSDVLSDKGVLSYSKSKPVKLKVLFNEGINRNIVLIEENQKKIYIRTDEEFESSTPKGTKFKFISTQLNGEAIIFQLWKNLNLRLMTSDSTYFIEYGCVADFNIGKK